MQFRLVGTAVRMEPGFPVPWPPRVLLRRQRVALSTGRAGHTTVTALAPRVMEPAYLTLFADEKCYEKREVNKVEAMS